MVLQITIFDTKIEYFLPRKNLPIWDLISLSVNPNLLIWVQENITCMRPRFMHVLVTCKYKNDRIKSNEKRWRHHFPHYKSMGAFCWHGHQSFDPICLKTLCSLSPPPVMLHIKFDQDWPTDLRDTLVPMCKIFVIQGQVTPMWVVWSGPKSNSSQLLCLFWLPATLMMIQSKMNELAWRHHFPIISLREIF